MDEEFVNPATIGFFRITKPKRRDGKDGCLRTSDVGG